MCDVATLIHSLQNADIEVHEKAAHRYYTDHCGETITPELATALLQSVQAGNRAPAAFLMVARADGVGTHSMLLDLRDKRGEEQTKFNPWDKPISIADALLLPIAKTGNGAERLRLLERIEESDPATLTFLLQVIDEIESVDVLNTLARVALAEKTPIGGGAPSGAGEPRRVADLAVDALVARLSLDVGFDMTPANRYSDDQILAVTTAQRARIPQ